MSEVVETKSKYMNFVLIEQKPATQVWGAYSKSDGSKLAEVRWYPNWRGYNIRIGPLYENEVLYYSEGCLLDLINLRRELNATRELPGR